MRALNWQGFSGTAKSGNATVTLGKRPDAMPAGTNLCEYVDGFGRCATLGDEGPSWRALTADEILVLDAYLVDCERAWGGAQVEHAVDGDGKYLGIVPIVKGQTRVTGPGPGPNYRWFRGAWVQQFTLAEAIQHAWEDIDAAAGAARVRYITDVPGQQATYLRKYQQAQDCLRDSTVGPYVRDEAEATGTTFQEAAQNIVAIADQWDGVVGPAIEKARRIGKLAVADALTNEDVEARRQATLKALAAI